MTFHDRIERIEQAVRYTRNLVAQGVEYPNASCKAAIEYKVDASEINAEYDAQDKM